MQKELQGQRRFVRQSSKTNLACADGRSVITVGALGSLATPPTQLKIEHQADGCGIHHSVSASAKFDPWNNKQAFPDWAVVVVGSWLCAASHRHSCIDLSMHSVHALFRKLSRSCAFNVAPSFYGSAVALVHPRCTSPSIVLCTGSSYEYVHSLAIHAEY